MSCQIPLGCALTWKIGFRIAIFGCSIKAILLERVVNAYCILHSRNSTVVAALAFQSNLQSGVIALLHVMDFIGEQSENYRSSSCSQIEQRP